MVDLCLESTWDAYECNKLVTDNVLSRVCRRYFDSRYSQDAIHPRPGVFAFGIIGISIEALGSFFDSDPLEQEGLSKKRFSKAVDELFKPLKKEYDNKAVCLFRGLRCGMAHIGRPQGKIAFTTRSEAQADGNKHLNKDHQGMLVLVAEDLANDL
jgi:hypothetical protein